MKKILLVVSAAFLLSSGAHARPYGDAGCGLGSILMGADGNQTLAVTTNGSSYSQLFGITSGTSNCTDDGAVSAHNKVPFFIDANKVALSSEMARGSGETLNNLADAMGCQDKAAFGKAMQKNYATIFPNQAVETERVSASIENVVKADNTLSKNCSI